jgi:hypothetical protein
MPSRLITAFTLIRYAAASGVQKADFAIISKAQPASAQAILQ